MGGDVGRAGDLEHAPGDVAEILDRGRRAAGDADDPCPVEDGRVGQVGLALDLDRGLAGDPDEPRQLLRVRARPAADDDHQVDFLRRLDGVLLAPDRHRADGVDDLELVAAPDHERGELLELPRRLGRLARSGPSASCAGPSPPTRLLRRRRSRRARSRACRRPRRGSACRAGRSCSPRRRAGVSSLCSWMTQVQVPSMTSRPRCVGALHHVGPDAVGADHDGRAVIDVVERLDGLDAQPLEVADHALVVDDLAEGVRRLAGGRRLLGLVDRLADAVAEAGPLRDPDLRRFPYGSSIAGAPSGPGREPPRAVRLRRRRSARRGRGGARRSAAIRLHDQVGREAPSATCGRGPAAARPRA